MEKFKKSRNVEGELLFCRGWDFSKSVSVGPTFIKEIRVLKLKMKDIGAQFLPSNFDFLSKSFQ